MASSSPPTAQEKVKAFQSALDKTLHDITQDSMAMQKKTFQCCVACFDKPGTDYETVGRCIKNCQQPAEEFSATLNREMQTLQNSIQVCQDACFNKFSQPHSSAKDEKDRATIEKQMEECTGQCFVTYFPEIAQMDKRLRDYLKKQS
uniref:Protein FAM136A n=1 Tax=Vitrella brassicaformis TaxID=1169539 RepID=A0A7S1K5I2_9ALVE|mmetsp:Transcript_3796/g.8678  ORF Transcript_3796/g.8678 Transcript_3796/m.8678 type:complete len:147 (+) Transcript_3796:111-551(+)